MRNPGVFGIEAPRAWLISSVACGRPDFAFRKPKLAIFVDGCFWHGCPRCFRAPQTFKEYWQAKVARNKARDETVGHELRSKGWKVLRVWECQLKKPAAFLARISRLTH
jgi:DNA mismatch endonuclease (patch repair protein)